MTFPTTTRRNFLKRAAIGSAVLGVATPVYSHWIERQWLEVVRVPLSLGLPRPMKVAVVSDIHIDPLNETDYLREVIAGMNALNPDMIFFTGDFITGSTRFLAELTMVLSAAKAANGCYAVLGNHDCSVNAAAVSQALRTAGVRVLINESIPMPGVEGWYLSGLDSFWTGRPDAACIAASPASSRHILLAHEPDAFDQVPDSRIALQVSGHTHGGQIRVPLIGALILPKWGRRYQMGLYRKDGRFLYVNRGIGTVGQHFRLNCRPEITLLELS